MIQASLLILIFRELEKAKKQMKVQKNFDKFLKGLISSKKGDLYEEYKTQIDKWTSENASAFTDDHKIKSFNSIVQSIKEEKVSLLLFTCEYSYRVRSK